MFYFTTAQIDEIEKRLAVRAKKDTDFDLVSSAEEADLVAIIHNGRNVICRLDKLPGRLKAIPYDEITYPSEEQMLEAPTAFSVSVLKDLIGITKLSEFDPTATYKKNDYVFHVDETGIARGYFFKSKKNAGNWDVSKVEEINYSTIASRLKELMNQFEPEGLVYILNSYFTDGKANQALADEDGKNIKEYYALKSEIPDYTIAIAQLVEGKLDKFSMGAHDRPVWFDDNKEPQVIDSLHTPGDIRSDRNIEADGGVSAYGIAELNTGSSGGGGTVTGVEFDSDVPYDEDIPYIPSSGIIKLPSYPDTPSQQQMDTWDAKYNKPVFGIPSTDLSDDVQESLDKADTSVQPEDMEPVTNAIGNLDSRVSDIEQRDLTEIEDKIEAVDKKTDVNAEAIEETNDTITQHITDTSNPHQVTKSQVGLGNADNTSDQNKPVSIAQQAALDLKVDKDDLKSKGSEVHPIYFDSEGDAQEVTGIEVPGNIVSTNGGVAAHGIADLSKTGGCGSGTITEIRIDGTPVPAHSGVVDLPAYPEEPDVVEYSQVDSQGVEDTTKVPTAYGVKIIKGQIDIEDLDEHQPHHPYLRGDLCKVTDGVGVARGYRCKETHTSGSEFNATKWERLTFKTLARPLHMLESDMMNMLVINQTI